MNHHVLNFQYSSEQNTVQNNANRLLDILTT